MTASKSTTLWESFHSLENEKKALAIILPVLLLLAIIFLILLVVLFARKRYLKSKLNKTPGSAPPDGDSDASINLSSPDLIARPASA